MIWIVSLILFVLEVYILKHTVWFRYDFTRYGYKKEPTKPEPIIVKLWHILVLAVGNIGYLCWITLPVFISFYLKKAIDDGCGNSSNTYWRLQIGWVQKLGRLLNVPI